MNGIAEEADNDTENNYPDEYTEHHAAELNSDNFTQERVTGLWFEYIEKIKDEQPRMYPALKNQVLKIDRNEYIIEVDFINNAQIDDFRKNIKPSLLNYLKENLKIHSVTLQEILDEEVGQKKTRHFTEKDKLKHMTQKNSSLQRLKKEFDLDFD